MAPGEYYHIYNRGNNREKIFYEESNYHFFLNSFNRYLAPYLEVLSYCLMPTHFQFFIRVSYEEYKQIGDRSSSNHMLSKAFKNFFISYSKSINKIYHRTGSLFQASFKKKEITNDAYYSSIVLYIHMNPVVGGLCNHCSDWKYSSYNAFVSDKPSKIRKPEILNWFGNVQEFIKVHNEKMVAFNSVEHFLFNDHSDQMRRGNTSL